MFEVWTLKKGSSDNTSERRVSRPYEVKCDGCTESTERRMTGELPRSSTCPQQELNAQVPMQEQYGEFMRGTVRSTILLTPS